MDKTLQKFLKKFEDLLAYQLSKIINLSVKRSAFSDECKTAKLRPLFKKEIQDKGMHTGMILTELQEAFKTLDLKIILKKMKCLAFKISVIESFSPYLSSKKFFLSVDNVFSKAGALNFGN